MAELGIEQPVRYIEKPCPERQRSRQPERETEMRSETEGPAPQRGDGRRIEAEQVPILKRFVEESCQTPV
jgi:hypothetical protein